MIHARTIQTLELFPALNAQFMSLLKSLQPEDWHKSTISKLWSVKDIVSHLLDGNIRRISMQRDQYFSPDAPGGFESYCQLVAYLNTLNADWVKATRRISPPLLITLHEITHEAYYQALQQLDPDAPALFAVAWAGDETSPNWFDIAREYTEKWHHQQQIRLAVDKPGIMDRAFYFPFLDTCMCALPLTYKSILAPEGTLLQFTVTGEAGGNWFLRRDKVEWNLTGESSQQPSSVVEIPPHIAWRLFFKGIDKDIARQQIVITGDTLLGSKVLDMISVMA